jgi:hypothetical protein
LDFSGYATGQSKADFIAKRPFSENHDGTSREQAQMFDQSSVKSARISRPPSFFDSNSTSMPTAVVGRVGNPLAIPSGLAVSAFPPSRTTLDTPHVSATRAGTHADRASPQSRDSFGRVPLNFEQNVGQTDSTVDFIARTGSATVFLTPTTAVFSLQNSEFSPPQADQNSESGTMLTDSGLLTRHSGAGAAVHMKIVGANPDADPTSVDRQPGIVNYFVGNDPNQWHANIPTFAGVRYDEVYPGIDLAYYGNNGQLEYDFIVSPGADPSAITLNFAGADSITIDPQGNLVVHTAAGSLVQQKPYLYQESNGTRQQVAGAFSLSTQHSALVPLESTQHSALVSFNVGNYDVTRPLVIDPLVLGYSTFLGGGGGDDFGTGIAVDSAGNTYVAGYTQSTHVPTTPGAFDTSHNSGYYDAFVAKLSTDGASVIYGTYLGGSDRDHARGIAVDAADNAYLTGDTISTDFATTPGAFDTSHNGSSDAFVAKLSADGASLMYGTYLGGSSVENGYGIAVDPTGYANVIGSTVSTDFPTTPSAFDTSFNGWRDAFVAKVRVDGTGLVYGSYFGGSGQEDGYGIAVDVAGNAYMTGMTLSQNSQNFPITPGAFDTTFNGYYEVFVAKLRADGTGLIYSTYIGGNGGEWGSSIALDDAGNAYVTGETHSNEFPTTPGAYDTTLDQGYDDMFVTKLSANGSSLVYSTFIGGDAGGDFAYGIALDPVGNAYVTGYTTSADFPTTPGTFDVSYDGNFDAVFATLSADGSSLLYGTYLGASINDFGNAVAVDDGGNAYVIGETSSPKFPTTPGALKRRNRGSWDGFVTKFAEV